VPAGNQLSEARQGPPVTRAQIKEIVGEMDDIKAARIIASGATLDDLEQAAAWAAGESDVMSAALLRASVKVQAVYDILTAEEKYPAERS